MGSRQDVEVCVNEYFDSVATGGGLPAIPEPEVRAPIAPIEDVMLPPEAAFPNAAPIIVDSLRDFRVESGECDILSKVVFYFHLQISIARIADCSAGGNIDRDRPYR